MQVIINAALLVEGYSPKGTNLTAFIMGTISLKNGITAKTSSANS